jgi:hypothetical protein
VSCRVSCAACRVSCVVCRVSCAVVCRVAHRFPSALRHKGILIVRFDSNLFFANVNWCAATHREAGPRLIIFSSSSFMFCSTRRSCIVLGSERRSPSTS